MPPPNDGEIEVNPAVIRPLHFRILFTRTLWALVCLTLFGVGWLLGVASESSGVATATFDRMGVSDGLRSWLQPTPKTEFQVNTEAQIAALMARIDDIEKQTRPVARKSVAIDRNAATAAASIQSLRQEVEWLVGAVNALLADVDQLYSTQVSLQQTNKEGKP